ncbi:MAG: MBL fold metallo-hydrolase [Sphaerochaetaceae bacterium]|nr:MBL fold metallo-hydrolase [Sphaerochaetaceae bacterium]
MTITTLMDNWVFGQLDMKCEHGFSCLIEHNGHTVLFDTGASGSFLKNAVKLHKDLSKIDALVISHAHYDHTGGCVDLARKIDCNGIPFYTGPRFFNKKYAKDPDGLRYLGPDFSADDLASFGMRHIELSKPVVEIFPGLFLVGEFQRTRSYETPDPRFVIQDGTDESIDSFDDEIMLVAKTSHQIVVITGCSHPGIMNMLDTVSSRFNEPIIALFGGIHLFNATEERREAVMHALSEYNIGMLCLSHCTGEDVVGQMKDRFAFTRMNGAGAVFSFE